MLVKHFLNISFQFLHLYVAIARYYKGVELAVKKKECTSSVYFQKQKYSAIKVHRRYVIHTKKTIK